MKLFMDSKMKKGLIMLVVSLLMFGIISMVQSNTPFTCYYCHRQQTGTRHMVRVYGSKEPFCDSCFNTQKMLGNIK